MFFSSLASLSGSYLKLPEFWSHPIPTGGWFSNQTVFYQSSIAGCGRASSFIPADGFQFVVSRFTLFTLQIRQGEWASPSLQNGMNNTPTSKGYEVHTPNCERMTICSAHTSLYQCCGCLDVRPAGELAGLQPRYLTAWPNTQVLPLPSSEIGAFMFP